MPKLLLQYQGAVIKEIPITKGELTVGRLADNDIIIDNPAVSAHHCKIVQAGDTFFVEDLNSSNGVFLNAKKVMKSGLKHNDVIGIVKHALKFLEDRPEPTITTLSPANATVEATMMIAPEKRQEVALATATAAQKPALIHVTKGVVDQVEFELKAQSTYIGKSDKVHIKIKGKGLFGSAPENAAMIARRMEGYFLVPIAAGYAKLNGHVVTQKEQLKDGDLIEVGGTTLLFEDRPTQ